MAGHSKLFARTAAFAYVAPLAFLGGGAITAYANGPGDTPTASAAANADPYRDFGMVNGVAPKDRFTAWVRDDNGDFTNPDAKLAHEVTVAYVTGAVRSPWNHPYSWHEDQGRQIMIKAVPDWDKIAVDARSPENIKALVDLAVRNADDGHNLAIIDGTIRAEQSEVLKITWDVQKDATVTYGGSGIEALDYATTPEKIAAYVKRVESAVSPYAAKETMLDAIQANSNAVLEAAQSEKLPVLDHMERSGKKYGDYRIGFVDAIKRNRQVVASNQPTPP